MVGAYRLRAIPAMLTRTVCGSIQHPAVGNKASSAGHDDRSVDPVMGVRNSVNACLLLQRPAPRPSDSPSRHG